MEIYLAIDPGKSGAVAVEANGLFTVRKCPDTVAGMSSLIREFSAEGDCRAVMEAVHSMPRDGVKSAFTFGQNFGQWQGVLSALNIPVREIPPQKWMKLIGAMPKEVKDRKRRIRDFAEKTAGRATPLYAADALALCVLAPRIWNGGGKAGEIW